MAEIIPDVMGPTITLSSGLQVRMFPLIKDRNTTMEDIGGLVSALFNLVKDLDDRLEKLEKK